MITIQLKGGLGNQMFQVASALGIATLKKTKLALDISWFKQNHKVDTKRDYELSIFHNIHKLLIQEFAQNNRIIHEDRIQYTNNLINIVDGSSIDGYLQSYKYFEHVQDEIRDLFTFDVNKIPNFLLEKVEKIQNSESVSIHIRRGDYKKTEGAYHFHGICGLEYYKNAISYFRQEFKEPMFYIFTDDIDWAKQNFQDDDIIIVTSLGDYHSWIDMYLQSVCKHNIIANSSFSWWAAWLNKNQEKKVIAPKKWFFSEEIVLDDLYPKEWTILENFSVKLSVIIPTYNRANDLLHAIESVRSQENCNDYEILICDDGSTDDTQIKIQELNDEKIRYFKLTHSGKPAVARNFGLERSQGEWIAFLDSDDYWMPNKICSQMKETSMTACPFICSNAYITREGSNSKKYFEHRESKFYDTNYLLVNNPVICSSVLMHSRLLKGLRFDESDILKAYEDYDLWIRASLRTDIRYISEPLVFYNSDSDDSVRKQTKFSDKRKYKYVILKLKRHKIVSGNINLDFVFKLKNFVKRILRKLVRIFK